MNILRHIWKYICNTLGTFGPLQTNIDSHKWENKVEILRTLSDR